MAELTYREAVARGIAQEMARDPDVVFLGEDIGKAGGVFKATVGLYEQFGPLRVRDTPISEQAILGAAMGAAMTGLKPIAEIMFRTFSRSVSTISPTNSPRAATCPTVRSNARWWCGQATAVARVSARSIRKASKTGA